MEQGLGYLSEPPPLEEQLHWCVMSASSLVSPLLLGPAVGGDARPGGLQHRRHPGWGDAHCEAVQGTGPRAVSCLLLRSLL